MTGNVIRAPAMHPIQVQKMVRRIRQVSVENAVKVITAPRPHLNRPLPGTGYRGALNLYA